MAIAKEILDLLPFSVTQLTFHHKGENENFMIRTSDHQSYILKKYREERKQRLEIELEIDLCNYLRKNSVEVPEYVSFKDGSFIQHLDNRKYTIQKVISGFMICNPDEKHFYDVGRAYRALHDLKLPSHLIPQMPMVDRNTLNEPWPFLLKNNHVTQKQKDDFESYKEEAFKHLDFSANHLIHFDLHDGNIIYTPNGLCLIDWEECGMGNGMFDLAVTNTRLVKMENASPMRKALLSGYGETDLMQLKHATIFKFLYLASFLSKFDDVLKNETMEQLCDRYLSYFRKLESGI